jgi:DUF1365 family protein
VTRAAAQLWLGRTVHRRESPFERRFSHRIAMLEVDIDRLAEADALSRLFAVDRGAAISFRQKDHGARDRTLPLRAWVEAKLAEAGISLEGGAIRLISFPRVLGIGFAPISIWLGHGPDGTLRGVIYEVHNTFGETHSYVCAFDPTVRRALADKEFFVSPFFDVDGGYRFTLRPPDQGKDGGHMSLVVENIAAGGRAHVAALTVKATALSSPAILRWLVAMPISGLGVLIAIHWQAFRLFLKGAKYRVKPEQRLKRTTLTRRENQDAGRDEQLRKRA